MTPRLDAPTPEHQVAFSVSSKPPPGVASASSPAERSAVEPLLNNLIIFDSRSEHDASMSRGLRMLSKGSRAEQHIVVEHADDSGFAEWDFACHGTPPRTPAGLSFPKLGFQHPRGRPQLTDGRNYW